jgi:hypothetical protein
VLFTANDEAFAKALSAPHETAHSRAHYWCANRQADARPHAHAFDAHSYRGLVSFPFLFLFFLHWIFGHFHAFLRFS